ncbi:MAG: hypothetical protein V7L22_06475, partial [Nostoc sp.]|uniref:hypothetical protein n=1 Tax=Nostoc sp. TaxID=1180 RepID=UPI002FF74E0C
FRLLFTPNLLVNLLPLSSLSSNSRKNGRTRSQHLELSTLYLFWRCQRRFPINDKAHIHRKG